MTRTLRSTLRSGAFLLLALGGFVATVEAQQGHPLVGTWQGYWGATKDTESFLTLVMTWDGKTIDGIVNPGPDSTRLGSVRLDSSDWTVRIETDLKVDSGDTVRFVIEGKLEDLGSPYRTLVGTWRIGEQHGELALERQGGA